MIGQAAEFDYAGTQACKAVREEGVRSILVNSNPATIMTDLDIADAVYIEPLTVPVIERIIARERPEGLLPTLGGQTGLNLAVELANAGVLDKYNVRLLGTPLESIRRAEDRELFNNLLAKIGEPVLDSEPCESLEAWPSGGGADRAAGGRAARLHAGRHGRGHRAHTRAAAGHRKERPRREPYYAGPESSATSAAGRRSSTR